MHPFCAKLTFPSFNTRMRRAVALIEGGVRQSFPSSESRVSRQQAPRNAYVQFVRFLGESLGEGSNDRGSSVPLADEPKPNSPGMKRTKEKGRAPRLTGAL